MLDYDKQRKLIVVCALAIVVVVIFTIIYLVHIWTPEPEQEKVYEAGVVDSVKMDENDVLLEYYEDISEMLMNSKLNDICSLVGEDYLEYFDYTLDDVKQYITDKNIIGKRLELVNSTVYSMAGYSNVYYLDIKSAGEVYSLGVIVRETSPKQYTIAFDKFIDYKENTYTGFVNSVELKVQKQARFVNSIEYRVRITNNYDKAITINTNKEAAGLTLVSTNQGTLKKPIMLSFANQSINIEQGQSREYTVSYSISDDTDFLLYNVFVLHGVTYSGMTGTSDLEFYMT